MTGQTSPLESEDLKKLLSQRFPFLMIDRVVEAGPDKVVAVKNVSVNEHYFVGHFPQEHVMPGALIIEAMAQAGIILHRKKFESDKILFLVSVKSRFFHPVYPGDQLTISAQPVKMLSKMGIFKAEASVGATKAAEAEIAFGVR